MLDRLHLARLPWPRPDPRGEDQLEADLADEFEFHLAQRRREYERQGLDAAQARRAAADRFGDVQRIKAQCRRIAREERIMLQKINLVLMIVVLLVVIGVSVQMYITQRSNTLAIQAMSAQLAEQAMERKAAERGTGVVFVDGIIRRPGVYDIPADGLTMSRLLVVAGRLSQHANATVHRRIDDKTEQTYTVEVLADGTVNGEDLDLQGGDLVIFSAIRDPDADQSPQRTMSTSGVRDLDAILEGNWRQVHEDGRILDDGMSLTILGAGDVRNLRIDPTGTLAVPELAHPIRLVFLRNRSPNLEILDCFQGPNYTARGRWQLSSGYLLLNLAPAPGSQPEHEQLRFVSDGEPEDADPLAVERARVNALQDFVLRLLTSQDPGRERELAVKDVLDAAAGQLDAEIIADPEIEAKIRAAIEAAKRQTDAPKQGG